MTLPPAKACLLHPRAPTALLVLPLVAPAPQSSVLHSDLSHGQSDQEYTSGCGAFMPRTVVPLRYAVLSSFLFDHFVHVLPIIVGWTAFGRHPGRCSVRHLAGERGE